MTKTVYKVQNWAEYNKALIERGSINLWISDDISESWHDSKTRSGKGFARIYSDAAIELCHIFKSLYRLPLRATQGFMQSLFLGYKLPLKVPNYTTLSRRQGELTSKLPRTKHGDSIDIVLDSTGLKVYGDGEWKVRQHGVSRRRTWRKLHLAIDPLSHEIVSCVLTGNEVGDSSAFAEVVDGADEEIERIFADGAYDGQPCYEHCARIGAEPVIPPRMNAVPDPPDDTRSGRGPRMRAIERIMALETELGEEEARKQWKVESDYHTRSLAETAMFRFKITFGDRLSARIDGNQEVEAAIKCKILNRLTQIGMPISTPVIT